MEEIVKSFFKFKLVVEKGISIRKSEIPLSKWHCV
jgi:hypothetical protein